MKYTGYTKLVIYFLLAIGLGYACGNKGSNSGPSRNRSHPPHDSVGQSGPGPKSNNPSLQQSAGQQNKVGSSNTPPITASKQPKHSLPEGPIITTSSSSWGAVAPIIEESKSDDHTNAAGPAVQVTKDPLKEQAQYKKDIKEVKKCCNNATTTFIIKEGDSIGQLIHKVLFCYKKPNKESTIMNFSGYVCTNSNELSDKGKKDIENITLAILNQDVSTCIDKKKINCQHIKFPLVRLLVVGNMFTIAEQLLEKKVVTLNELFIEAARHCQKKTLEYCVGKMGEQKFKNNKNNIKDDEENTLLHLALREDLDALDSYEYLLQKGGEWDWKAVNNQQETLLHKAAKVGKEPFNFLRNKGLDINKGDIDNVSPFGVLASAGHWEFFYQLLNSEKSLDVNKYAVRGRSILSQAVYYRKYDIAEILIGQPNIVVTTDVMEKVTDNAPYKPKPTETFLKKLVGKFANGEHLNDTTCILDMSALMYAVLHHNEECYQIAELLVEQPKIVVNTDVMEKVIANAKYALKPSKEFLKKLVVQFANGDHLNDTTCLFNMSALMFAVDKHNEECYQIAEFLIEQPKIVVNTDVMEKVIERANYAPKPSKEFLKKLVNQFAKGKHLNDTTCKGDMSALMYAVNRRKEECYQIAELLVEQPKIMVTTDVMEKVIERANCEPKPSKEFLKKLVNQFAKGEHLNDTTYMKCSALMYAVYKHNEECYQIAEFLIEQPKIVVNTDVMEKVIERANYAPKPSKEFLKKLVNQFAKGGHLNDTTCKGDMSALTYALNRQNEECYQIAKFLANAGAKKSQDDVKKLQNSPWNK